MPENLQKLNEVIQIDEDVWQRSEVGSMPKKISADVGTIKKVFKDSIKSACEKRK